MSLTRFKMPRLGEKLEAEVVVETKPKATKAKDTKKSKKK